MAIENTYLLGKNITLGCGFDLQAKAPLDSRQTVPSYAGLQALINGDAAYEGMIVYDEETKKTYQAQKCDSYTVEVDGKTKTYDISFREFCINEDELKALIASETTAAMEFKGAATALPENPAKGDMYKVTASFKVGDEDVYVGDSIVYDGEQWFIIPSGDDIEDTWRPVTGVDNDATLTFAAGDKLEKTVAADGTITYKHVAVDAPTVTPVGEDEQTRTYIASIETDGHGHITGYKTATENVEDTNTTYEFEGQAEESSVYFTVTSNEENADPVTVRLDAYSKNEADGKFVAKEEGKSLISDTEIARLAEVDNYDDEEVRGLIGDNAQAIEDLEAYVGTFTHGTAKTVVEYINAKTDGIATSGNLEALGQRVTANEGKIADLETDASKHALKADVEAEFAKYTKTVDLPTDLGDFTNNAGYAKTADVNAELDKKADKTQVATDIADAIAPLATTEALNAVKETAEAAQTAEQVSTAISDAVAAHKTEVSNQYVDKVTYGQHLPLKLDVTTYTEDKAALDLRLMSKVDTSQLANYYNKTDIDGKGYAVASEVEATYATKTELGNVDAKFENYVTAASYAEDKAAIEKSIEDETKALAEVDAGFETRIANIEANFGDGEGTVEAQIASAVKAEEDARKEAVKGVQDAVDAMYTNVQIDDFVAGAKSYADGLITEANLDQYTTEQEVKDIVDGVIKTATNKETLDSLVELVEYIDTHSGDAINMATAIGVLEGKVEVIEEKPAYGITATQISNWDNEVGAKALAETKTTTAEVKNQIEAYGYATTGYADDKASAAQSAAIADAAGKYETKGTAQGIVDALKLGETYEPIGAETRAIAAAKTETESQVKALAGEGNTSTVKKNADDIADLFEMFQWGSF